MPPAPETAIVAALRPGGAVTNTERLRIALEEEILSGVLVPGARLDEAGLSARYGTSRTPVREALKQLAASGLVLFRPHRGATVVKPTLADLIEMFEVMAELEAACARFAARRHTTEDRAAIDAAYTACKQAAQRADPDGFYAVNNTFHEAIYRASRNRYLERQTCALRNRLKPYRRQITFHPGRMTMSLAQHRAVMDAIFGMDQQAAARCMREHVGTLRDDVALMIAALDASADDSESGPRQATR